MKLSKFIYTTSLSLLGVLCLVIAISVIGGQLNHPEKMIKGTWKEVAWRYDKHDNIKGRSKEHKIILNDELKESIAQGLHIRQAETWVFDEKAKLTLLKSEETPVKLNWRMKGRGHILALNYNNTNKEYYQIQKLTKDEMVLYFENDAHARGIIQIVFKKIKS